MTIKETAKKKHTSCNTPPVRQYDKDMVLIATHENAQAAKQATGIDAWYIRRAARKKQIAGGFRWSFVGGDFEATSNKI